MKREVSSAMLGLGLACAFMSGWGACLLVMMNYDTKPSVSFTGEPSRGAFAVPQSGIKYRPPSGGMDTWQCLVAVTGENPAVWHYRVWREDDPEKTLSGKGVVVVP